MSGAGGCPRSIAAPRLGFDPIAETEGSLVLLEHASEHEEIASRRLEKEGYELVGGGECEKCFNETGNIRKGIHVEIETSLIRLLGHLDRRIKVNDAWYPLEIKSFGRFPFDKFVKELFEGYPGYAGQEACYLEAEQKPGFYACINRDNGTLLKYSVPFNGVHVHAKGFTELKITTSFSEIIDKLHEVELYVRDRELPPAKYNEKDCRWCRFKYLCTDTTPEAEIPEADSISLIEAADMWKKGNELEKSGSEMKDIAKATLLSHAKDNNLDKFKVGGVSVSYLGERRNEYFDKDSAIKDVGEDMVLSWYKKGKAWDNVRIIILKEKA